ncbi:HupE/UreJ family protein [Pontibacter sp. JAM-7]|uniref:HupE/UreJ family protein n=1 Tax=Pontibacter sp. JAM-7 TaxID=3366581 RepID=UPI003AF5DDF6
MRTGILVVLAGLLPAVAQAHTGHELSGFWAGLLHPLTGLDHLLAFFCAGLWLAHGSKAASLTMGAGFLLALLLGAGAGLMGLMIPQVEQGILLSLLVLGGMVIMQQRLASHWLTMLCGALLVMHGMVHGLEIPQAASAISYLSGFLLASAVLFSTGLLVAQLSPRLLVQSLGAMVAATGLWFSLI